MIDVDHYRVNHHHCPDYTMNPGFVFAVEACVSGVGGGVLVAECAGGQESRTPPDGL